MTTTCKSCETEITVETRRGAVILGQRCPSCGERVDASKIGRRGFLLAGLGALGALVAGGVEPVRNTPLGPALALDDRPDILDILNAHLERVRPALEELYRESSVLASLLDADADRTTGRIAFHQSARRGGKTAAMKRRASEIRAAGGRVVVIRKPIDVE